MAKRTTKPAGKNDARINRRTTLAFYDKYLMTVTEAACYFHIGDRKMYELVHQYEGSKWVVRNGTRLMVKKDMFASWLDQQSEI